MCDVAIPNKEILYVYENEVLNRTNQNNVSISIHQAIFSKDTSKLQSLLEDFMLKVYQRWMGLVKHSIME